MKRDVYMQLFSLNFKIVEQFIRKKGPRINLDTASFLYKMYKRPAKLCWKCFTHFLQILIAAFFLKDAAALFSSLACHTSLFFNWRTIKYILLFYIEFDAFIFIHTSYKMALQYEYEVSE